ncbi:hypothetical protein R1flu_027189 [Riccia fluitans]|uniref:AIG1-type G domain-containing protein n=1 Tax=Riccia fluitans TaxID=41844 RepID=A0ABD1XI61_9MARC
MEIPNPEFQRTEESESATSKDPAAVTVDPHGPTTILLFGKTGDGKSTVGNMLLTEDEDSSGASVPFAVGDSLEAVTTGVMRKAESKSKKWQVIDTVGLLSSDNDLSDSRLAKKLYDELFEERQSIHWLCYVKKATKFTKADERCWQ